MEAVNIQKMVGERLFPEVTPQITPQPEQEKKIKWQHIALAGIGIAAAVGIGWFIWQLIKPPVIAQHPIPEEGIKLVAVLDREERKRELEPTKVDIDLLFYDPATRTYFGKDVGFVRFDILKPEYAYIPMEAIDHVFKPVPRPGMIMAVYYDILQPEKHVALKFLYKPTGASVMLTHYEDGTPILLKAATHTYLSVVKRTL